VVTVVDDKIEKVVTIVFGGFESLHLGHRRLLSHVSGVNDGGVLTFEPLPKEALGYSESRVLTDDERLCAFESMGINQIIKLPFEKIKDLEPETFLSRYLEDVQTIVVGENFRFGRNAVGDISLLKQWCQLNGKNLIVEPLVSVDGEIVSTKAIKNYIHHGNMERARKLLGYPYFIRGPRVHGNRIGSKIGVPTVNLHWSKQKTRPPYGVYDGFLLSNQWSGPALASFGKAPTFDRKDVLLEIYVPGIDLNIRAGEIVLYGFHRFIREEKKFPDATSLVQQIREDENDLAKDAPLIEAEMNQLLLLFSRACLLPSR